MQKGLMLTIVLLLLMPFSLGATIHGKVYDYSFRLASNSVVEIDTVPGQRMVAVDGSYSFSAPPGEYVLSAFLADSSNTIKYYVEDRIIIAQEGDYVRDLIMFPSHDFEEMDLENGLETDVDGERMASSSSKQAAMALALLAIIAVLIGVFCFALKKCRNISKLKRKNNPEQAQSQRSEAGPADVSLITDEEDYLAKLAGFIRKNKRVTQKEIRKEFPVSEAKISLMLTDLESQGKIRKIKKGRGNIIIYND